jgi:uncharacterized protein YoxC
VKGETILSISAIVGPLISAVLVAVLNNWDKINKNKKYTKEIYQNTTEMQADVTMLKSQMKNLTSAQRTALQTQILEKCKRIQQAIETNNDDFGEELKQLIILYREYHLCGFNSQGKLYFNDTINRASEHNNVLVRDLMNTYFSEYDPTT